MKVERKQAKTPSNNSSKRIKAQRRRFIRLQLKSQVRFQIISQNENGHKPGKNHPGLMLNISQGGMLLLTNAPLQSDDFLAVSFEVPQLSKLANVLGKVKRVEPDGKKYLAGVEFCELADFYPFQSIRNSSALPRNLNSFRNKFEELLLRRKLFLLA